MEKEGSAWAMHWAPANDDPHKDVILSAKAIYCIINFKQIESKNEKLETLLLQLLLVRYTNKGLRTLEVQKDYIILNMSNIKKTF